MTTPDPDKELQSKDFSFWFALRGAVDSKDWAVVTQILSEHAGQHTPRHTLTVPVFSALVLAGKPALVADMLGRGYMPGHNDFAELIDKIDLTADEDKAQARQALCLALAALPAGEQRELVIQTWHRPSAPIFVPKLREAEVDVLLGGDVIDIAVSKNRADMIQLLIEQQISPMAPRLAKAMLADSMRDTDMYKAWWMALCANAQTQTGLRKFDHMRASGGQWRAAAFLNPIGYDKSGAEITLLGILAARGRAADIFDARYWRDAREDVFKVYDALEAYGIKDKVSLAALTATLNQQDTQARLRPARSDKFKL